jgi:small-conductance mechanosensitive channel
MAENEIDENGIEFELNYKKVYHAERQKRVWDSLIYSHQRIDILIIALSSAGIYICLETVKYLYDKNVCCINPLIKISAFFLLIAIISNLFSQWCATKIHFKDYDICEYCISLEEEDIEKCKEKIKKLEVGIAKYEKYSTRATKTSFISLILGVVCLLIFFFFIF